MPQNARELFNLLRHSSLRVTVERAFGGIEEQVQNPLLQAFPYLQEPSEVGLGMLYAPQLETQTWT